MKTAVEYLRYSSDRQTEQSIEGQKRVCDEYAERNGITIIHTYIDRAMSGTNDNRDDFQRMLSDSDKKAWDYVLVYKLDRFSRNKYEMAIHRKHLSNNGIKLISVMENIPDSPEGILLESLLEGMNQYYSEELSQKTKRGMNETRLKGNFIGGYVNYGYTRDGNKLFVNEDEADVLREIFTEYAGGKKIATIVHSLNERHVLNRGKPFLQSTVYSILNQEKYTGLYTVNGVVYDKIYPPIISRDIYGIVHSRLEKNKAGKHPPDVSYMLRGKLYCGLCGRRMTSYTGTSKSGKINRYYKCYKTKSCKNFSVRKNVVEQAVTYTLLRLLSTQENIALLTRKIMEQYEAKRKNKSALSLLEKELADVNKSLSNLLKAIEAGIFTDTTKERLQELENSKYELEQRILTERTEAKPILTEKQVRQYLLSALNRSPQQMIDLLVEKVSVFDDKIDIVLKYTNDPPPPDNGPKRGRHSEHVKTPERNETSERGFCFTNIIYSYESCKPGRKFFIDVERNSIVLNLTVRVYI